MRQCDTSEITGRGVPDDESVTSEAGDSFEEFQMWLRSYRDSCRWQAAKTGPPHEYTVRVWRQEFSDEFERAVAGIMKFGHPQSFYQSTYVYLDLDGFKYWTMGHSVEETTVINRDLIENRFDLSDDIGEN